MNIDSTNNMINNAGQGNLNQWQRTEPVRNINANEGDSTLRSEYAFVIRQAQQEQDISLEAKVNIRNALQAGEFDSPEAVKATARNLMMFGI